MFQNVGDALLLSKGIESEDHVAPIKELTNLQVEVGRPINLIGNLRRLRHNINYYGYKPNFSEIENTISIADSCFEPLLNAIMKKLE